MHDDPNGQYGQQEGTKALKPRTAENERVQGHERRGAENEDKEVRGNAHPRVRKHSEVPGQGRPRKRPKVEKPQSSEARGSER